MTYVITATAAAHFAISCGSILSIVSAGVWWITKYFEPSTSSDMLGMRPSCTLGPMSAPPPPGLISSAAMPVRSVAMVLTVSRAASAAAEPEAQRPEHAAVGFQHHHVLRQLGAMLVAVGQRRRVRRSPRS